jgi:hypothetical protein
MYNLGERFGTFVIAAALLFAAMRIHRSTGKHTKITKQVGLVLAFLAGCAFLVTFVGAWMAGMAGALGAFFVAGLIACAAIIAVDWLLDGKPDRPAFWAAFMLLLGGGAGHVGRVRHRPGGEGRPVGSDRPGPAAPRVARRAVGSGVGRGACASAQAGGRHGRVPAGFRGVRGRRLPRVLGGPDHAAAGQPCGPARVRAGPESQAVARAGRRGGDRQGQRVAGGMAAAPARLRSAAPGVADVGEARRVFCCPG